MARGFRARTIRNYHSIAVIGLPITGSALIEQLQADGAAVDIDVYKATSFTDAVQHAQQLGTDGTTILLSPGAASFVEFKNFEERGRKFIELSGVTADPT